MSIAPTAGSNSGPERERTEAFYREHGAAVGAFCRSLLRDRSEAEDATQQVFLAAHRALLNGVVPREPLAWLLAVARNECHARFRRRSSAPLPTEEPLGGAVADASVHALRAAELASIWDEVGRMPAAQREAFLLREIRGLSYGQLASHLSLSAPSVRSLLLRARSRLRHRLGDVAAAVGGAPGLQTLLRLVGGGEGASPLPVATKAAAVGLGALALAGGGTLPRLPHRSSASARHAVARHRTEAPAPRAAAPDAATGARGSEDRRGPGERGDSEHPRDYGDGRRSSGSDGSGSGSGSRDGGGTPIPSSSSENLSGSSDGDTTGSSGSGGGDSRVSRSGGGSDGGSGGGGD